MANNARGFATIRLGEAEYDVSLSLGALAELESEFGVETFEEALNFGDRVSATKLRKFMRALMRGNSIALTPEVERNINQMAISDFMVIVSDLMAKAGFAEQTAPAEGGGAPLADATAGEAG